MPIKLSGSFPGTRPHALLTRDTFAGVLALDGVVAAQHGGQSFVVDSMAPVILHAIRGPAALDLHAKQAA